MLPKETCCSLLLWGSRGPQPARGFISTGGSVADGTMLAASRGWGGCPGTLRRCSDLGAQGWLPVPLPRAQGWKPGWRWEHGVPVSPAACPGLTTPSSSRRAPRWLLPTSLTRGSLLPSCLFPGSWFGELAPGFVSPAFPGGAESGLCPGGPQGSPHPLPPPSPRQDQLPPVDSQQLFV